MPYRDKDRDAYKVRIQWNGQVISAGTGTDDKKAAVAVEEFTRTLKENRDYHPVLDRILSRDLKLARAYTLFKEGRLAVALKVEPVKDLVPLVDKWKAGYEGLRIREHQESRTEDKYEAQIRKFLGERFLAKDFTARNISEYLRTMKRSGSTRNRHHTALSVFADFLVTEGEIEENPLRHVKRYHENPAREVWFDSQDEAHALLAELDMLVRALVALILCCGVEWQACKRLRPRNIDFNPAEPTVHAQGGKKPWRNRIVVPSNFLFWKVFADYARTIGRNDLVFAGLKQDRAIDAHAAAMKAAGLDKLDHAPMRLHDLKHCSAVFSLRQGWPLHLVAKGLGHKDTTLVQRNYGRFVPNMDDYRHYLVLAPGYVAPVVADNPSRVIGDGSVTAAPEIAA